MDPIRWKTVNEIFHAALDLSPGERERFVAKAVEGDHEIHAEVKLLLDADANAGSYIESPWMGDGALRGATASVNPGDILSGRFRIVREVGEGGMGRVYEAFDSELAVYVALKVIRPEIASDPGALRRFRQEVQVARRITHPNICRTYDLERETGSGPHRDLLFLTMEFLDGETLAARIARTGAIPLAEALEIARQVADALEAARALGIVHRDIKPANVMLAPRPGGEEACRAVVTDFGLAGRDPLAGQTFDPASGDSASGQTRRPVGTLAYMAPEQLEGATVSTATDVYAFGLLLFEMVTGSRAFPPENFLSGIARRLSGAAPDPRLLVPKLREPWARAIEGCLRTRPEERFSSAADAIAILNGARSAPRAQRWFAVACAFAVFAVLAAGGVYYRSRHAARPGGRSTIVLADFANSTDDAVFDDALKTALTVSLKQSPYLDVLPESRVSQAVMRMTLPADAHLTPERAREVCQRTGSRAYIAGSIARLGNRYVLGLKAVNCESGEQLAEEQVTADRKEEVLNGLGRAVSAMRGKLGESITSVQRYDVPLADATTSSLEALKALSLGRKAYQQDTGVALRYFQQASELDPNFAMAWHDLGRLYFTLDETGPGRANFAKAFELRNHSSEREKLEITATYYENVTGDLGNALITRKQQRMSYPLFSESYDGLGYVSALLGKYEDAIEMFRGSIRLNPDNPDTYGLLANSLLALQQPEESRKAVQQALSRKVDGLLLRTAAYDLAFLRGDAAAMTAEEHWMQGQPQYENFAYSLAADRYAYEGRLGDARRLTRMAADSSVRADSKETAAIWYENSALREAVFGDRVKATQAAENGLKMAPAPTNWDVEVEAALAYATNGDSGKAESLAGDLSNRFPSNTQVRLLWLPAIRAQVDLNRNQPSSAIEDLQSSIPLEFGQYPFNTYGSCLYTNYVRGEAYLAAGQGKLSAGEFRKILGHNGIVENCWTGALARLGLARASALEMKNSSGGDAGAPRIRALSAYADFLTLWKYADAGLPVVEQAKSEYAALGGRFPR